MCGIDCDHKTDCSLTPDNENVDVDTNDDADCVDHDIVDCAYTMGANVDVDCMHDVGYDVDRISDVDENVGCTYDKKC